MKIIRLFLILETFCLLSCVAPSHGRPKARETLVLPYDAFAPQVAVYPLIGFSWYQWNSQGPDDPRCEDDVRVVVYKGISLDEVQRQFPVIRGRQDYRYISYHDALAYCDGMMREDGASHLRQTGQSIRDHFRPHSRDRTLVR